jgi:hypothetical protein
VLDGDARVRFQALAAQYRGRFGLLETQVAARFE